MGYVPHASPLLLVTSHGPNCVTHLSNQPKQPAKQPIQPSQPTGNQPIVQASKQTDKQTKTTHNKVARDNKYHPKTHHTTTQNLKPYQTVRKGLGVTCYLHSKPTRQASILGANKNSVQRPQHCPGCPACQGNHCAPYLCVPSKDIVPISQQCQAPIPPNPTQQSPDQLSRGLLDLVYNIRMSPSKPSEAVGLNVNKHRLHFLGWASEILRHAPTS